jgi:hypothetical protein
MIVKIFLLNSGMVFFNPPFIFISYMVVTLLLEAAILYFLGYKRLKYCCLDSLIVNFVSFFIGLLLYAPLIGRGWQMPYSTDPVWSIIAISFLMMVIIEGILLRLLTVSYPLFWLIAATLIMNLVTFMVFYILFMLFFIY